MSESSTRWIMVLSANKENAARDRIALERSGFAHVKLCSSWEEGRNTLSSQQVSTVILDGKLKDVSPLTCLRAIRKSPRFGDVPVVMVTDENRREKVLDSIAAGISGYVLRPYLLNTFGKHIKAASASARAYEIEEEAVREGQRLLAEGRYQEAIEEFEEVVAEAGEAQRHFDLGMQALARARYGAAIAHFNRAIKANALFAEAYKGLADAYKGKGDEALAQEYRKKAAEVFALQDRFEETRQMFAEILKAEPDAVNPFNSLGVDLRKKGDLIGALHAYGRALELTPEDEHVHFNIAKAHYYSHNKNKAREHLLQALRLNPHFTQAREFAGVVDGRRKEGELRPDAGARGPMRLDQD